MSSSQETKSSWLSSLRIKKDRMQHERHILKRNTQKYIRWREKYFLTAYGTSSLHDVFSTIFSSEKKDSKMRESTSFSLKYSQTWITYTSQDLHVICLFCRIVSCVGKLQDDQQVVVVDSPLSSMKAWQSAMTVESMMTTETNMTTRRLSMVDEYWLESQSVVILLRIRLRIMNEEPREETLTKRAWEPT